MGWGGARPNSGPERSRARKARDRAREKAAAAPPPKKPTRLKIGEAALIASRVKPSAKRINPFVLANHPPSVFPTGKKPTLAMDEAINTSLAWAAQAMISGMFAEGIGFLGYPYLAELTQRAEYRVISETIATEATRKWIKIQAATVKTTPPTVKKKPDAEQANDRKPDDQRAAEQFEKNPDRPGGDDKTEKIKAIEAEFERLKVQDHFRVAMEQDGFFGRSHIYVDIDEKFDDRPELLTPIGNGRNDISKSKVAKGAKLRLQGVEAVWCYPSFYNATDPLSPNWYKPERWYCQGKDLHTSRLITFVGREVPDMLKPAYSFGGLSMSQMAKPYVDNWLRTRQSVADIVHAFSVMVLSTDLSSLEGIGGEEVFKRADFFNNTRDNRGLMLVNHEEEELKNVSAPLSSLDLLQAQSQEHMASVSKIPIVKLLGIQPAGLNASSEGEITTFDDTIAAYQTKFFGEPLKRILGFVQLSLFGEVDDQIEAIFMPLRQMTEKERGEIDKAEAEADQIRIDTGVIWPEEARKRVAAAEDSPYAAIDVEDVPDLQEEEASGLEPDGGVNPADKGGEGGGQDANLLPFDAAADDSLAADDFNEADHPRGQPGNAGQFGSGGGGGGSSKGAKKDPKQVSHAPQYGQQHGHFTAPSALGGFSPSSAKKSNIGRSIDVNQLKKVGAQMGSNPGGVYEDEEGKKFYVKKGKSEDHVRNELVAAALYDLAGTPTLNYRPVEGGGHIATEMSKLDKDNASKLSKAEKAEAARDFAVHAWLGNWDAVGLGGDNIGTVKGIPTALDLGGAMEYRAQGSPKGKAFGTSVGELDTLRDASVNKDAAGIFGGMTPAEMRESARYVTSIKDDKIRATVEKLGGKPALAEKLIARKNDVGERARFFGSEGDPSSADGTMVVPAGSKLPIKTLNGVKFAPWRPPADWNAVDGTANLDEPEYVVPEHKKPSTGVIIREPDGRVWVVQPRGGYGGYEGTFPKGGLEPGLSMQANAIKEAYEESGLKVRITGFAGDHEGDMTMTRYYHAEREGGDPSIHEDESEGVVLVPEKKAGLFLNRKRDHSVLAHDAGFEEAKHPRDDGGKFSETAGGGGGAGGGGSNPDDDDEPEPEMEPGETYPGHENAPSEGKFKSKKEHIAHLLTKEGGTTTAEILKATAWPSVSVPQQAASLGLKLVKWKEGGVTKYKATPMTVAEKQESAAAHEKAKAEAKAKVEAAPASAPLPIAKPQEQQPAAAKVPATAAELEKAKKTVALKLEYVPGAPQGNPNAQKLVDAFNKKYAGVEMPTMAHLQQKVADFKALTAAMIPLMSVEQQAQAQKAAEQKEQQAKAEAQHKAKAAAAAAEAKVQEAAEKEKLKSQHAEVTKELGITDPEELQAFDAFIAHFGGTTHALTNFKKWQSEAVSAAKNNPGHGYDKLSGFEMACIKAYTGPQSGWINSAIRDDVLTPAQYMFEKVLNRALGKLPKKTGLTKRGLTLSQDVLSKLKAGVVWTHRNFASTNAEGWSGNTKLHIEATGKGGAYVAPISSHKGEGETLFQSNLRLYITKTESKGGQMTVYCKEI